MKRKVIVSILIIVMILALALSAAAYFMLQARMGLFSGRVEYVGQQPGAGDPQLVLRVEDEDIGQSGDLSTGSVVFPVLTNVQGYTTPVSTTDGPTTEWVTDWVDEAGNKPISAPKFVLKAEGGDVKDVRLKLIANGDVTASAAIQFGIATVTGDVAKAEFLNFAIGDLDAGYAETEPLSLGYLCEGEEVEIEISVWVNSEVYEKLGITETTGDFKVEAVFTADAET